MAIHKPKSPCTQTCPERNGECSKHCERLDKYEKEKRLFYEEKMKQFHGEEDYFAYLRHKHVIN